MSALARAAALIVTLAVSAVAQGAPEAVPLACERAASEVHAAAAAYRDGDAEAVRTRLTAAQAALTAVPTTAGELSLTLPKVLVFTPRSLSALTPLALDDAATELESTARALRTYAAAAGDDEKAAAAKEADDAAAEATKQLELARNRDAWVTDPFSVLAILVAILATLFVVNRHPRYGKLFKVVPLLVWAYFVPTVFSNLGVIPIASPLYEFIKKALLPASLVLLVLAVDIPAILRLGRDALVLFLAATVSIVIGGPLAYLLCSGLIPEELGDQAWKGLAALSGSWIGGGANFVAIGESVGATASTLSMIVVVDIAVAEVWMAVLLLYAGREKRMDQKIGADRRSLDEVRGKIETFQAEVARPTNLPDLLLILAIAFGTTAIATLLAKNLPDIGAIVRQFTWVVLIVTTVAAVLSFTPVRRLEGAGATAIGSVLLYLLVAAIGAHAQFSKVLEMPGLVVVGTVWMLFHVVVILSVRRWLRAPIFFAAVGSKANIGGAASAPILASAFHPALAPVGVLLAVGGYVLGTYAGLLCAFLLELVHGWVG